MQYFKAIKVAFSFFWNAGSVGALAVMMIYLVISIIPSLLLLINKRIFENFSKVSWDINLILALIGFYFILQVTSAILSFVKTILMKRIQHIMQVNLQKEIQNKMLRVNFFELDNSKIKDLIQRVSKKMPDKSSNTLFMSFDIIDFIIQIVTSIIILVEIHWLIPMLLIIFTIPYFFLYKKMCFDNYFNEVNQGNLHRKNWYLIQMLFKKHYNKEMKIYQDFEYLGEKQRKLNKELHDKNYEIAKKYSWYGIFLDMIKSIGKILCIFVVLYLIMNGKAGIAGITVLFQSMDSIQNSLMNGFSKIRDFSSLCLAYNDYLEFCNLPEETVVTFEKDKEDLFIEMQHISFDYPTKKAALNNVNLEIKKGEKIAIVGKNGSGKTTLVHILLGFYKPANGVLKVYDDSLAQDKVSLRNHTVYMMQNMPKYSLTLSENLSMGQDSVASDMENILNIKELIEKAPMKGDTLLGEENDDCYNISGGEWAKVGMVRNSKKSSPVLYVLDEPTAAMDPLVESKIFQTFKQITGKATTIFISHRLGMVSLADRIVVMDEGRIAEQGTHQELMQLKGLYYTMYTKQLNLYERRV